MKQLRNPSTITKSFIPYSVGKRLMAIGVQKRKSQKLERVPGILQKGRLPGLSIVLTTRVVRYYFTHGIKPR